MIKARDFKAEDFARFHPGGSLGRKLLCRVRDVMQTNLPIARPATNFSDILTVMNKGRMGVAIVMENHRLLGIITDGDIRRTLSKFGTASLAKTAEQIMTHNPKTIEETAFLAKAEERMKALHIHSLLAVNEQNQVTGIIEFST